MNRWVYLMLHTLFLSSWLALSPPPAELSHSKKIVTSLPASLLESRLPFCHGSEPHKRGCKAALDYLQELLSATPLPSRSASEKPENRFARLKIELGAAKIPESEWVAGALNAWLAVLDPHAKLVSKDESDRRASADKILVQGAGAKLRFHHGKVFVGYSMEGSAAESMGLKPGDRILSLNGKDLTVLNESAKRRWLSGTVSPYQLDIEQQGKRKNLLIHEKRYYLANVEAQVKLMANGAREGIIRIRSFDKDNTCAELRSAIRDLDREHVDQLRLNLNDNPGGLVQEAQCAAGLFLGKGKVFARLKKLENLEARQLMPASPVGISPWEEDKSFLFTEQNRLTALPLKVEINQNSASAAEMLAAALQDYKRAKVIGARSFGKGSMQSIFHPWQNENLYLTRTTHQIFRPSGAKLQFVGVTPDLSLRQVEGENFPRERELTL